MILDEDHLKCRLLTKFRREGTVKASSTIASEFVLGQTGCRSDLAIFNGSFIGVEVKSARDSLTRLPEQINAYQRIFDLVILLCDEIHVNRADSICPLDIGIYVWKNNEIYVSREAAVNSRASRWEGIRSLTSRQLHSCLESKADRLTRSQLEALVYSNPDFDVKAMMTESFESTYAKTTQEFMRATAGKRITPSHLKFLSRFSEERAYAQQNHDNRRAFWKEWEAQAQLVFG